MTSKRQLLKIAFDGPETSPACRSIGFLLYKNQKGLSVNELKMKTKKTQDEIWFSLQRLTNEMPIFEYYFKVPKGIEKAKKDVAIPSVYKFKDDLLEELPLIFNK